MVQMIQNVQLFLFPCFTWGPQVWFPYSVLYLECVTNWGFQPSQILLRTPTELIGKQLCLKSGHLFIKQDTGGYLFLKRLSLQQFNVLIWIIHGKNQVLRAIYIPNIYQKGPLVFAVSEKLSHLWRAFITCGLRSSSSKMNEEVGKSVGIAFPWILKILYILGSLLRHVILLSCGLGANEYKIFTYKLHFHYLYLNSHFIF